jgi:OOP family OmpA-OmpF porin
MNYFLKHCIIFIFCHSIIITKSQNLIINGDFENVIKCPEKISLIDYAERWSSPNEGTPDLFCSCSKKNTPVSIPANVSGTRLPLSGKCFAGIAIDNPNKEYLVYSFLENSRPIKNKKYCLSFNYSHSDYHKGTISLLGFLLSDKKIRIKKGRPINETGYESKIINDIGNWHKFCLEYVGTGVEKYLYIGSFSNEFGKIKSLKPPSKYKSYSTYNYAYYYIDDVILVELKDGETCACQESDNAHLQAEDTSKKLPISNYDHAIGKPIALQNLNFETNKTTLQSSSYEELNKLVTYLKLHPAYKIDLSGHTDNIGKERDNQQLSEGRTKAVADYLMQEGIEQNRISYKGYGSSRPVTDNTSEDGRKKNRRVEIKLSKVK